jgi:hypothetical protein
MAAVSFQDNRRAPLPKNSIITRAKGRLPSFQGIHSTGTPWVGQSTSQRQNNNRVKWAIENSIFL